jgi:hypothetical protein
LFWKERERKNKKNKDKKRRERKKFEKKNREEKKQISDLSRLNLVPEFQIGICFAQCLVKQAFLCHAKSVLAPQVLKLKLAMSHI